MTHRIPPPRCRLPVGDVSAVQLSLSDGDIILLDARLCPRKSAYYLHPSVIILEKTHRKTPFRLRSADPCCRDRSLVSHESLQMNQQQFETPLEKLRGLYSPQVLQAVVL